MYPNSQARVISPVLNPDVGAARPVPHNIEAEQGLLGTLLVDGRYLEEVADILTPEHFFFPAHQRIYQAIQDVHSRGAVATPITLKKHFENDGDLIEIGGAGYLAELAASVISFINAVDYARTIRDLYMRRELIANCNEMIAHAYDCDVTNPAVSLVETMESRLYHLSEEGATETRPEAILTGLDEALQIIERVQRGDEGGLMTGIAALDRHLNGFWPGDLVLVGGRPSMGKTVKALTVAHNVASQGKRVLFFNLEMSSAQLSMRLLARHTGMPVQAMQRKGDLKPAHFNDLVAARTNIGKMSLYIDETPGLSASQIRTRARRHKRRHGLDLIIIDYLGLMSPPPGINSKVYELAEITKALKNMAKEMGIPVLLLHQLSRGVEGRENRRPQLSDLRDSGAIEQDADIVIFLYREEYYLSREEPAMKPGETKEKLADRQCAWEEQLRASKGRAEAIIAKFRQGECGIVPMAFNGVRQTFSDINAA